MVKLPIDLALKVIEKIASLEHEQKLQQCMQNDDGGGTNELLWQ